MPCRARPPEPLPKALECPGPAGCCHCWLTAAAGSHWPQHGHGRAARLASWAQPGQRPRPAHSAWCGRLQHGAGGTTGAAFGTVHSSARCWVECEWGPRGRLWGAGAAGSVPARWQPAAPAPPRAKQRALQPDRTNTPGSCQQSGEQSPEGTRRRGQETKRGSTSTSLRRHIRSRLSAPCFSHPQRRTGQVIVRNKGWLTYPGKLQGAVGTRQKTR